MDPKLRPDTLALHADASGEADVAPAIHVATTFLAGNADGLVYARNAQPTRSRLEAVLGALEGGEAVTYASGQAATTAALLHCRPRRVAIRRGGYHGTHYAVDALAPFGVEKVALDAPLAKGDLVWVETPRNPTCEVEDIAAHAARARAAGAVLVVDSTFATPVLQRPLDLGADLVMHSTTKFIAGHSDALGGVLVARDPALAAALRGVRTLAVRVRAQGATAARLAAALEGKVARVWHPSLASNPSHGVAARQMSGPPAVLSIELATEAAARALPRKLHLFRDATSLGGVESLVEWRRKQDPEAPPALLRLSVGLEDADDLLADLEQGLRGVAAT